MAGEAPGAAARFVAVDVARTAAMAGMILFHFVRDLEMFGLLAPGTTQTGGWPWFARAVAGSFLFLAGVSLWLAHGQGIRWLAFLRRLAVLAAAAGAVTLATRAAMPGAFVYFGILHSIAVASVIGLAFLRLPAPVTLAAAAVVFLLPILWQPAPFDTPWLAWTGLSRSVPPTIDFEPVFPWVAPFLAGLALARLAGGAGLWRVPGAAPSRLWRLLAVPGRHSLGIYLLHQPLLIGAIWLWVRIAGGA